MNCNDSWNHLKTILHSGIEKFVPTQKRRQNSRPVWISRKVTQLCRQKRRRYAIYCNNRTDENLRIYKNMEKKCKYEVRKAKRKFEKKLSTDTNKKGFNSYLRKKTKSKGTVGPLKVNGNIVSDNISVATILNNYFASVFTPDLNNGIPVITRQDNVELNSFVISKNDVVKKLENLKNSSSCGPDGIPNLILKQFSHILSGPLTTIFNKSLQTSEVPDDWKLGDITPIHKKGSKSLPEHYRPVQQNPAACKIFESLIKDRIVQHLQVNNLLKQTQHGFLKGRSCTTNLLEFMEKILSYQDSSIPVDIIYLDFAKAFDKVPTKKLLAKIKAKGIGGDVLNWIAEWLNKRKQRVRLNGVYSDWLDVISGVPQGSVLGPLLFLIFIDDLDDFSPMISILSKFADDTKLGHPVINDDDKKILQSQLDQLCNWTEQWGMEFNVSKCKVMHIGCKNKSFDYTMNGENLTKVSSEKDVGITFEDTLKTVIYCK
jgi:hypothetical protein